MYRVCVWLLPELSDVKGYRNVFCFGTLSNSCSWIFFSPLGWRCKKTATAGKRNLHSFCFFISGKGVSWEMVFMKRGCLYDETLLICTGSGPLFLNRWFWESRVVSYWSVPLTHCTVSVCVVQPPFAVLSVVFTAPHYESLPKNRMLQSYSVCDAVVMF